MKWILPILFSFIAIVLNVDWIRAEYFGYEPTAREIMLAAFAGHAETSVLYAVFFWLAALRKLDI